MRIIILITITLLPTQIKSQNIDGEFVDGTDKLIFKGNRLTFKVSSNGGLVNELRGTGTFTIKENRFLIVETETSEIKKSTSSNTSCIRPTITVENENQQKLTGVTVSFEANESKLMDGLVIEDGTAKLNPNIETNKMIISFPGYQTLEIDYFPKSCYLVTLVEGETIEKQTVVFKINTWNNSEINLTLLTSDFSNGKLKKLEKEARKFNSRQRTFEKL